ncbi:hypothetical protein JTB14_001746 [Gonioctena quinquepunctata]|nr:hypothetical protein JTB14_001746 [Gonioctena quinquepunctata]
MARDNVHLLMKSVFFVQCVNSFTKCDSARILGIMPTASLSHQITYHPLWRELSLRGHEVTLLTTDPINDPSLTNLTEVSLNFVYDFFKEVQFYDTMANDTLHFWQVGEFLKQTTMDLARLLLKSESVLKLWRDGRRFDLVIAEAQFPLILGLIGSFKCPWIGVSSMDPALPFHIAAGNPSHPVLNPDPNLEIEDLDNPSFFERLASFIYRNGYVYEFNYCFLPGLTEIYGEVFNDLPPLIDVHYNISMLFLGTHPIFHNLRTVYPNTITLGCGLHFQKEKILSTKFQFNLCTSGPHTMPSNRSVFLLIAIMKIASCAEILAIMPIPSFSHQIYFHPLWRELSLRGHKVTLVTTDPIRDASLDNLTEIDTSFSYGILEKRNVFEQFTKDFSTLRKLFLSVSNEVVLSQIQSAEVNRLFQRDRRFDLVIAEILAPAILGVVGKFNCPWIGVSSMDAPMAIHAAMGNPVHPILNPGLNLPVRDASDMGFFERITSFSHTLLSLLLFSSQVIPDSREQLKRVLGEGMAPLVDVMNNMSMLFISTNPIFHDLRLLYPNTITVGNGMQFKEPGPLPKSPFQPLWKELALRGHEVTVLTTDPQKIESLPNLKEIDLSFTYDIYKKNDVSALLSNDSKSFVEIGNELSIVFAESQHAQLSSPEVQKLIHDEDLRFDLLLVEAQLPGMLAFAWRFQCPVIGVASLDCAMQYHDSLGNPVHPVVNPDYNLDVGDAEDMGFAERLLSFIYISGYKYFFYNKSFKRQHATAKQYFGDDLPDLLDIQNNMSMLFIAGMHIQAAKPLPDDIKSFLDGAKNGAIYFSLGSNVKSKTMSNEFKKAIVGAFANIPYRVLMKIDDELEGLAKNVLVRKWMPQQDILRHPNVKLFITQGGLQSLQEAVLNNIPLIGIPFFGDQITNVNKMVKRGYGVKVDRKKISSDILTSAIEEVMVNPRYREKAQEVGEIFRDEEIPSLQRAVYWTEYVIRHKGAKHLRSHVVGMPAWKYYMLDVIGFLTLVAHQVVFRPIWRELARRGHDLIVITTDPENDPSSNIREIDVSFAYEFWEGEEIMKLMEEYKYNPVKLSNILKKMSYTLCDRVLSHPEIRSLLKNETEHFDLAVVEYLHPVMVSFGERFNCPYIGVASMELPTFLHNIIGNPAHPVAFPDIFLPFDRDLNFSERLTSSLFNLVMYLNSFIPMEEEDIIQRHFGNDRSPMREAMLNFSMMFINVDPAFHLRPLGPAFVSIGGGTHLRPMKPLPKDLQEYMDGADNGIVYFSLGTNVKTDRVSPNMRKAILDAFRELPYRVLWKFEVAVLTDVPGNVMILDWVPQQDILRHPKVKAFITQGGLQSMEETLFSHVPFVGIPFVCDQEANVQKMVRKGFGVQLNKDDLTKESLKAALLEVINNPRYRERAKELEELSRDQPMTGLEKALWWTEYVLRHRGAPNFRNPMIDLPFYQYYLIDVIGFLFGVIFVVFKCIRVFKNVLLRWFSIAMSAVKEKGE